MELLKKYQKALEIVSNKDNLTTGAFARDSEGNKVNPQDSRAVKWCSVGALMKFYVEPKERYQYIDKAAVQLGYSSTIHLHDKSDHETILKMFNLAIELIKKEQ